MVYAIAAVPPEWETEFSLGFSSVSYEQWHKRIEPGTRILIYKVDPVNAIIAEAEVQDNVFVPLEDLPEANKSPLLTHAGHSADYALPLRVIHVYPQRHYVAPEQLTSFMNRDQMDTWIPIDDETYRALREPSIAEPTGEDTEL